MADGPPTARRVSRTCGPASAARGFACTARTGWPGRPPEARHSALSTARRPRHWLCLPCTAVYLTAGRGRPNGTQLTLFAAIAPPHAADAASGDRRCPPPAASHAPPHAAGSRGEAAAHGNASLARGRRAGVEGEGGGAWLRARPPRGRERSRARPRGDVHLAMPPHQDRDLPLQHGLHPHVPKACKMLNVYLILAPPRRHIRVPSAAL